MNFKESSVTIRIALELRDTLNEQQYKQYDFNFLEIIFNSLVLNECLKHTYTKSENLLSQIFEFQNEVIQELDNDQHIEEITEVFQLIALHLIEKPQLNKFQLDRSEIHLYSMLLKLLFDFDVDVQEPVISPELSEKLSCFRQLSDYQGDVTLFRFLNKII